MPGYKGHLFAASLLYASFVVVLNLINQNITLLFAWLLSTFAGALFPDIDTKSKGQQIFYFLFSLLLANFIYLKKYRLGAWAGLIGFLPLVTRHRGLFHSGWFLIFIVFLASYYLTNLLPTYKSLIYSNTCFFSLGVFSHLLCDFGPYGVKYLYRKLTKIF